MGDKPSIESMRAALANLTEPKKWGDDQEGSRNLLAWAITRLESLRAENEALKAISCCVPCGDQFDTEHQRGTCGVCLNAERARADEAEKALALIGERAVVDWDDCVVGAVDAVVKDPQRYGDWLRETLAKAHRADALAARAEVLEEALRNLRHNFGGINSFAAECAADAALNSDLVADLSAHDAKVREPLEKRIAKLEGIIAKQRNDMLGSSVEAVREERNELKTQADDLSTLIRQLVHSLNKHNPGSGTAARAMDYLRRKGLQGSILRGAESQETHDARVRREALEWAAEKCASAYWEGLAPKGVAGMHPSLQFWRMALGLFMQTHEEIDSSLTMAAELFSHGAQAITDERRRQIKKEGWTPEHDDEHDQGELATAAASYAISPARPGRR